jgi:hypothetical protein|tara:strand:- start:568 stop:690 length:123 start_codon:yes stop_codon:yes gene_type:complete
MGTIARGIAEGIENSLGIQIEYSLVIGVVIVLIVFYYILK